MLSRSRWVLLGLCAGLALTFFAPRLPSAEGKKTDAAQTAGWKKGTGWGWIWGKDDERGAKVIPGNSPRTSWRPVSTL